MTCEELYDALKRATGPDRALDTQIERRVHGLMARTSYVPRYTASIDMAAKLLPQGWNVYLAFRMEGDGEVHMHEWRSPYRRIPERGIRRGNTPALALCLIRVEHDLTLKKGACDV